MIKTHRAFLLTAFLLLVVFPLTLSGFLRPIDIGSRDAVGSDVLADAQISYSAKGSLGKPKNGRPQCSTSCAGWWLN